MSEASKTSTVFIKCVDTGKTIPVPLIGKNILSMTVRIPAEIGLDRDLLLNLYRRNREAKYYIGRKFGMEFSYEA